MKAAQNLINERISVVLNRMEYAEHFLQQKPADMVIRVERMEAMRQELAELHQAKKLMDRVSFYEINRPIKSR